MNRFTQLVREFRGKRVAVLGDFVADVFIYGEISRISREAPVLVLNQRETQLVPGGGANAVYNLHALGAIPLPIGIVGKDAEGEQLIDFFRKLKIDTRGIRVEKSWKTPTKTRILAGAAGATGTGVSASAAMIRCSRPMSCADASSVPSGGRRSTSGWPSAPTTR